MTEKQSKPSDNESPWQTYEQVARYVVNELRSKFGLAEVEGKQKLRGQKSDVVWEIDAKGIRESDGATLVIEVRRHTTSRLAQEDVAAIAYRISDVGAVGGITVSPLPLQKGAEKLALAEHIKHVTLDPNSTLEMWGAQIEGVITVGITESVCASVKESLEIEVRDADGNVVERRLI